MKKKLSMREIEKEVLGERHREFCDPERECPNCGGILTREGYFYGLLIQPPKEEYWICERCDYQEEL